MNQEPNFHVIHPGEKGIMKPHKSTVLSTYPFRFREYEQEMFISRYAFFSTRRRSKQKAMENLMFGTNWEKLNAEFKSMQKKLGLTDAELRRKIRGHRPHKKRAA